MPQPQTSQRADEISARWQEKLQERKVADLLTVEPTEVEMPSGDVVLAIRANLLTLLEAGRIPDGLTPFVLDLMRTQADDPIAEVMKKIEAQWDEYQRVLNNVWITCVVAPRTTSARVPPPGEVSISRIELNDKVALFNWAQGVSDHLAAFRDETAGTLRVVVDESGVSKVHRSGAPGNQPLGEPVAELADQPGDDDVRPVGRQPSRGDGRGKRRPAKERQADETRS